MHVRLIEGHKSRLYPAPCTRATLISSDSRKWLGRGSPLFRVLQIILLPAPNLGRWSEVTRRVELWVQLMELNDAGEFTPVEILPAKDVRTGGIFELKQVWFFFCFCRFACNNLVSKKFTSDMFFMLIIQWQLFWETFLSQGQSRRVQVELHPVPDSGTMPLICMSILSVSIGDVKVQNTPKGRDSLLVRRDDKINSVVFVLFCFFSFALPPLIIYNELFV